MSNEELRDWVVGSTRLAITEKINILTEECNKWKAKYEELRNRVVVAQSEYEINSVLLATTHAPLFDIQDYHQRKAVRQLADLSFRDRLFRVVEIRPIEDRNSRVFRIQTGCVMPNADGKFI